ncbi:MAG: lamin tail domain-containing protein [Candidatus Izemoplasmatales bacterium]
MKKLFGFISLILLFGIATAFHYVEAASPVGTPVDLSITSYFDEFNKDVVPLTNVAYGSKIAFDSSVTADDSSYTFLFWQVNGTVNWNLAKDYQFTVTNNLDLVAMFKPADKFAVVFMDSNGELIDVKYVNSGVAAVEPDTTNYTKVGFVYDSTKWSQDFSNVTSDIVTYLQYVPVETPNTFTLSVENGSDITVGGTGTYDFNKVVTVEADANDSYQVFKYWRVDSRVVSYSSTYSFTMLQNTTVTAVYDSSAFVDAPIVTITPALSLRGGYDSFLGQYYLPAGYTYVEHGLINNVSVSNPTLDSDGTVQHAGTKINASTNEFLISLDNTSSLGNVRGYLVYKDGSDVLHTIYSEVETPKLFISEYGENGTNKWIELYNPTNETIDLSQYSVDTSNASSIPLSGSLNSGDTYSICNSSPSSEVSSYCDLTTSGINFNGDDAVSLYYGSVIIDTIGAYSGMVTNELADMTLIRKLSTVSGNANFNINDWIEKPIYYYDNIDVWGFPSVESVSISGEISVAAGSSIQLTATVEPHGSDTSVTWSSSNESVATVNSAGLVSGVSEGTIIITATSVENENIFNTYEITVSSSSSITSTIIIYEIYGSGGNTGAVYKSDYVILYNTTSSSIDLTGYSIQYASSTGTTFQVQALSGSIAANGYFVIRLKTGTVGSDLPSYNVSGTIDMSGTKGKVALVNSTTALSGLTASSSSSVIDFVGYGSANDYETSAAPAPGTTTSVQRTSFVDTDNNSADFAAVTADLSYLP